MKKMTPLPIDVFSVFDKDDIEEMGIESINDSVRPNPIGSKPFFSEISFQFLSGKRISKKFEDRLFETCPCFGVELF